MSSCYHPPMSSENDNLINFIASTVEAMRSQMATRDDLVRLESRMETMQEQIATMQEQMATTQEQMATMQEQMATKEDLTNLETRLRNDLATKNDLNRLETTMQGEFGQVHLRLNTLDRAMSGRMGQIETDVSRLRSVVYLLVKDDPDMLRILGQPTPGEW